MEKYNNYSSTRLNFDKRRDLVWKEITLYLSRYINKKGIVIELGSGYCNWINNINAVKKIAVDKYIDPKKYCSSDVQPIFGDFIEIKKLQNGSVDIFLASNFFEHLKKEDFQKCLEIIKEKLKIGGIIIIIQPNYYYSYKNYFDDFTHETIWSHESLKDFLQSNDFKIVRLEKRFLPFSMKSKLPINSFFLRLYLNLPIRPFAGQMLLIAKKPDQK